MPDIASPPMFRLSAKARPPDGPMSRRTLVFRSRAQETGFLQYSAERLLSGVRVCSAIYAFLGGCYVLGTLPRIGGDWAPYTAPPEHFILVTRYCWAAWSLLGVIILVVTCSPKLYGKIGLFQREVAVAGILALLAVQQICVNPWYLGRLLSIDSEIMTIAFFQKEARLVLNLAVLIVGANFTFHIRWIVSSCLVIAINVAYATAVIGLGCKEPYPAVLIVMLMLLTVLAVHGKRQLEYTERTLFLQLVSERTLRAEAEFQLTKMQKEAVASEETGSQCTSPAGRVIENLSQASGPLEPLAEIGRREQWLLDSAELTVDPGMPFLGAGGFGIVASASLLMTPVAIKFPKQNVTSPSLSDIGNELRVLRKLRHPNIVGFHGCAIDFQRRDIVVVLERVFGHRLDVFVQQYHASANPPFESVHGAFQVLLGTCCALVYLHSRTPAIVHGDLKDENICVERRSSGMHAKLLDFGLARVLSSHPRPLGSTIRWSAPEVFSKNRPTPAADVFSFGRVIYFVLVGRKPLADFDWSNIRRAAAKQIVLQLAWPPQPSPEAEWCGPLVDRATMPNPDSRPSMAEMCRQLQQATRAVVEAAVEVTEGRPSETVTHENAEVNFWVRVRDLRQECEKQCERQLAQPDPESRPSNAGASADSGTDVTSTTGPVRVSL